MFTSAKCCQGKVLLHLIIEENELVPLSSSHCLFLFKISTQHTCTIVIVVKRILQISGEYYGNEKSDAQRSLNETLDHNLLKLSRYMLLIPFEFFLNMILKQFI